MNRGSGPGSPKIAPLDRFEDLSASELEALAQDYAIFAATGSLTRRASRILRDRPLFRDQPVLGANLP